MRLGLATAIRYRGDVLATMDLYRDALELCRAAAWPDGEAAAHGSLGNLNRTVGAFDLAAHHYEQSLRHFRRTGHRRGQAVTLGHLGAVYRLCGRLTEAADAQAEARAV
jgi:tetratricopeptide (TPR) repeat protein